MEKIYGYTGFHKQKTQHSLDNIVEVLQGFLEEYTDTTLKKIVLEYCPLRPEEASYPKELLETDYEIDKTLECIEKMSVLNKERHFDHRYRRYKYELPISHYSDVLKLVKDKGGKYFGTYMFVHQYFNFKQYDYAEVLNFLKSYDEYAGNIMAMLISEQDEVNCLTLRISNDIYNIQKCCHDIVFRLLFPEFSEPDKEFLRKIEKELKIHFLPGNFYYYYLNKQEKRRYKREKIEI